ncbi:MAG: glycosyltransferase family 2 protein [Oligoflexia bacterium]|nr:glycosyltransferase family 2 protein [Oligoflexia bacterium]
MRLGIVVPTFNCATQVTRVLQGLENLRPGFIEQVVQIDNCSQDDTVSRSRQMVQSTSWLIDRFECLENPFNMGLGGSFRVGLQYAREEKWDGFFFLHGDDQADPADIVKFYRALIHQPELGCIWGSRFADESSLEGYSGVRKLGNQVLNGIFSFGLKRRITDIGSGLNLFVLRNLPERFFNGIENHIAFDVQILTRLCREQIPMMSIPIKWRQCDQISNAPNIQTGILVLKTLAKELRRL